MQSGGRLSRASDEILQRLASTSKGTVLTSFWRYDSFPDQSGTPIKWITSLSDQVIEIYCSCDPEIAAKRFVQRIRHPGHLDGDKDDEEITKNFRSLACLGPLGIGRLIQIDTTDNLEITDLVNDIKMSL